MGTTIEIFFDNRSRVFRPGQRISGKVKITTSVDKICNGVLLNFTGITRVSWNPDGGGPLNKCSEEQKYYDSEFHLWGNGIKRTFSSGEHLFHFNFILPTNIPDSFESAIGHVRHTCSVELKLGADFDKKKIAVLSVRSEYDLNKNILSVEPIVGLKGKVFGLCCDAQPVTLSVNVNQSGFICGEAISICGECTNLSKKKVSYSRAELVQKITYHAKNGEKMTERVICSVNRPAIDPRCSDIWNGVKMSVPVTPPSTLPGQYLINIAYELHFSARLKNGYELSIQKPIIIGTIPLRQNFNRIVNLPRETSRTQSSTQIDPAASTSNLTRANPPPYKELYPTCPPANYYESSNREDAQTSGYYNEAVEDDSPH